MFARDHSSAFVQPSIIDCVLSCDNASQANALITEAEALLPTQRLWTGALPSPISHRGYIDER